MEETIENIKYGNIRSLVKQEKYEMEELEKVFDEYDELVYDNKNLCKSIKDINVNLITKGLLKEGSRFRSTMSEDEWIVKRMTLINNPILIYAKLDMYNKPSLRKVFDLSEIVWMSEK